MTETVARSRCSRNARCRDFGCGQLVMLTQRIGKSANEFSRSKA